MKIARFFAGIFGTIGTILMVGAIGLCLLSLNTPARIQQMPREAVDCSEELMEAISRGDYEAAATLMYGQPDLGVHGKPADQAGEMIWTAFLGSISYEFKGPCYVLDAGLARDVAVTALDVPSVTEGIGRRAHEMLTEKVASATDMAELYDETNNFREELVNEVLSAAVVYALAEDAKTVTRDVTVKLICRDGQWWAVPDGELLQLLSGGIA